MSAKFKNLKTDSLPSHWSADFFGNLVDYKLGKTPPRASAAYWKEGKYPWVSISDMTPHGVVTETAEKVSQAAYDTVFRGKLVPEGSLLMSFKLTIGRMSRLGIPAFHNEAIISFQPDPEKLSDVYLSYYLSQINYKDYQDTAIKGQTLNKGKLNALEIALPPLPEQKKIAHILSTVQRAIEAQERIIQTTTELKKALMHKLFTEGLRHEPQKQTEIGPVPQSWEVTTIGDVTAVKGGKRLSKGDKLVERDTGFPYIRVTDFNELSVDIRGLLFLTEEAQRPISRYIINRDDVFISIAGSIGITGMIPPELDGANLTENAARLISNDWSQLHPRFLMYWLASHHCQAEIKAQTVKNAQPKLALARIKSLKVPLPTHDEQVEIARALDLAGCKAENARAKRDQLQDLFRTLLHELMTAKTRVVELEISA
jgi:type I restriction enzyme S subunit